jgi:Ferredoxin-like domain in Api92-like protein
MPNWCSNNIVVTGPCEEIARFAQMCIRQDQNGQPWFDFNSLIPMPAILEETDAGGLVDDALMVLGCDDLVWIPRSLEERMKYWEEALKEKIGRKALEKARQSIDAFEQTGAPNWYVWRNINWGTKWNACDFRIIRDEAGRYECRFETAWSPPEPVYVKLAEMFTQLCFEISGGDDQFNFDFEATARDGAFSIHYGDPTKEGFCCSTDSDFLLDHAKAYGNDPERFLCVALCQAIASNQSYSEHEDRECEKAVVAWARGDSKEESENSCRDVIARNHRWIKKLITDWQFTVYAPGEIRFRGHTELEVLDSPSNDDVPF